MTAAASPDDPPPPPLAPGFERSLLVALNAADTLSREAALLLSRRPAAWLADSRDDVALAAAGTGRAALAAGRKVARCAPAIARREERGAAGIGAAILTRLDGAFPARLAELELPPAVLYCHGRLPPAPAIAIVGSRDADPYGLEVAERFAAELAAAGLVVVSGFAVGIDAAAHSGALRAGGETVAVLGCGVDVRYPRAHDKLRRAISSRGALISEFRMGTHPEARHFPIRNRIIACLAVGTLVVRAAPRSGSLITARQALELGRDVWAVPGNIFDSRSVGVNSLIRDGALPVQHPREILESLPCRIQDRLLPPLAAPDAVPVAIDDERCRCVLAALPRGELVGQDDLVGRTGLPVDEVAAHLLTLELGGWVRRYPGPAYCRRP